MQLTPGCLWEERQSTRKKKKLHVREGREEGRRERVLIWLESNIGHCL